MRTEYTYPFSRSSHPLEKAGELFLGCSASSALILLSFTGALMLPIQWALIIALTPVTQIEVFRKNAHDARVTLRDPRAALKRNIAVRELSQWLNENENYHFNEEQAIFSDETINAFWEFVESKYTGDVTTNITTLNLNLVNSQEQAERTFAHLPVRTYKPKSNLLLSELNRKHIYLKYPTLAFAGATGISCMLVSLRTAEYSITTIGDYFNQSISDDTLPWLIFPLAIFAGLAYTYVAYNSVAEMVMDNTFKKTIRTIADMLKEKQSNKEYGTVAAAILLGLTLLTLVFGATFSLGSTWWSDAKKGCAFIPYAAYLSDYLSILALIVVPLAELAFNVRNSVETVGLATHGNPLEFWEKAKEIQRQKQQTLQRKESDWQLRNPFRALIDWVDTPFRITFFMAYCFSTGIGIDDVTLPVIGRINRWIPAIIGALNEALTVFTYYTGANESEFDEGRVDIAAYLLMACLSPLHVSSALWAYSAGLCSHNPEHRILLSSALKHSFLNSWETVSAEDRCPEPDEPMNTYALIT